MENKVRDFIESYKNIALPKMTISEFIRSHNKEIWQKCSCCGNIEDVRITFFCPDCGAQLIENNNKIIITNDTRTNKNKS